MIFILLIICILIILFGLIYVSNAKKINNKLIKIIAYILLTIMVFIALLCVRQIISDLKTILDI